MGAEGRGDPGLRHGAGEPGSCGLWLLFLLRPLPERLPHSLGGQTPAVSGHVCTNLRGLEHRAVVRRSLLPVTKDECSSPTA